MDILTSDILPRLKSWAFCYYDRNTMHQVYIFEEIRSICMKNTESVRRRRVTASVREDVLDAISTAAEKHNSSLSRELENTLMRGIGMGAAA